MTDHHVELDISWLHAEVTKSMEHSSWNTVGLLWFLNVEWTVWILWLLHLGIDLGFAREQAHDWALASVLVVLSWIEHLGSSFVGKILLSLLLVFLEDWVLLLALKGFDMSLNLFSLLVNESDLAPRDVVLDDLEWGWCIPVALRLLELKLVKVLWPLMVLLEVMLMMVVVVVMVLHSMVLVMKALLVQASKECAVK